ncbi:MAG: hypothetical protein Q8R16_03135, partial [bacterium]|nr:hypothetical protein [bacterium]
GRGGVGGGEVVWENVAIETNHLSLPRPPSPRSGAEREGKKSFSTVSTEIIHGYVSGDWARSNSLRV